MSSDEGRIPYLVPGTVGHTITVYEYTCTRGTIYCKPGVCTTTTATNGSTRDLSTGTTLINIDTQLATMIFDEILDFTPASS